MNPEGEALGRAAARRLVEEAVTQIGLGLTDAEIAAVEACCGFGFADDHRAFLQAGLPMGSRWPNWREPRSEELADQLAWPADGVLFDVEHNAFWMDDWAARPSGMAAAISTARRHLDGAPRMIPVFGHRYLPAGPGTFGHPVLSMYQADVIYYGADLADYIAREFGPRNQPWDNFTEATVPFWRDIVS